MNLAPEPLGFRCGGSSPPLSLLIPASSPLYAPLRLFRVSFYAYRALPYHVLLPKERHIRSFGGVFESRPLSAQIHLTSELLRTL